MNTPYTPPKSNYIPVVSTRTGRLLFKFDPIRGIIEIQDRAVKEYVDLGLLLNDEPRESNHPISYNPKRVG